MKLVGRAWVFGDGIDTDVLAPGRYMSLSPRELAGHCLEAVRTDFASNVQTGDIILAGENFGIGSSREQAVESLKILGISAVVAKSFGGIFQRNAFNLGLMCLSCPTLDFSNLREFDLVELHMKAGVLHAGKHSWDCEKLPEFLRNMIADGGLIAHLNKQSNAKEDK